MEETKLASVWDPPGSDYLFLTCHLITFILRRALESSSILGQSKGILGMSLTVLAQQVETPTNGCPQIPNLRTDQAIC